MALDATQLHTHARLNFGGSEGTVIDTNPNLTLIEREDGRVDTYVTTAVVDGAEVVTPQGEEGQTTGDASSTQQPTSVSATNQTTTTTDTQVGAPNTQGTDTQVGTPDAQAVPDTTPADTRQQTY